MKKRTGILGILIAILALGIGYAAISAVTLNITGSGTISPDASNFNVHYTGTPTVTKSPSSITTTQTHDGAQTGQFTITGMTKQGDTVEFTYTVINDSTTLAATLAAPVIATNSNSTYFTVSSSTASNSWAANGGTTTQTVTVTAAKTPTSADETTSVTINLVASPDNS